MHITIKYFASLREQLGRDGDSLLAENIATVADVVRQLHHPRLNSHVLMAVNHEYATPETAVKAGDEVAFFPPVTGG
jgi:molybdopterin synthase sulfur carrier subunit